MLFCFKNVWKLYYFRLNICQQETRKRSREFSYIREFLLANNFSAARYANQVLTAITCNGNINKTSFSINCRFNLGKLFFRLYWNSKVYPNQTTYSLIFNVIYNGRFYWTFLDKTESGAQSIERKLQVMRSYHVGLKIVAAAD